MPHDTHITEVAEFESLVADPEIPLQQPPRLPGGLPGLGHAMAFSRDPVAFLVKGQDAMRGPFTFDLLGKKVAYFFGPEANAAVLAAGDDVLDRRIAYRAAIASLGEGVGIGAEPKLMAEQLAPLVPALQRKAMERHVPIMLHEVQEYVSGWAASGEINLVDVMHDLSAHVAAHCLAGPQLASCLQGRLPHLMRDLQAGMFLGLLVNPYLPLPPFRRRDRAREELVRAVKAVHRETTPDGKELGSDQQDLFRRFKEVIFSDGSRSDEDLAARLVLNAMFAATETTAAHAAWTGVLLLQHPEWLSSLQMEQDRLSLDQPQITPQLFHQMVHLRHCVMEAERMQPSVPLLMRTTKADFQHGPYRVPPGQMIMLSPAASHRLPHVFRDPNRYDPGRFGPGREEHRSRPSPLVGFGGGQHPCLGMNFAYQQIMAIWSVLLRTFDMELVSPSMRRDRSIAVNTPLRPCLMRYRRRVGPSAR